jgi:hypothetical protein
MGILNVRINIFLIRFRKKFVYLLRKKWVPLCYKKTVLNVVTHTYLNFLSSQKRCKFALPYIHSHAGSS